MGKGFFVVNMVKVGEVFLNRGGFCEKNSNIAQLVNVGRKANSGK